MYPRVRLSIVSSVRFERVSVCTCGEQRTLFFVKGPFSWQNRERERDRERQRERERETDTDTWFIVKATDPYTNAGGGGGGGIKNKLKNT